MLIAKEFHGTPLSMFPCDWALALSWSSPKVRKVLLDWAPPRKGCFKLNFNGASKGNLGPMGFKCVLRDHLGKVIRVLYGPLGECDSTSAKVMGLFMGLRELKRLVVSRYLVEGD